MASTQTPKTAFISYSSYDRKEAFAIKELLEASHIKVWLDFFDIQTTAELRQEQKIKVEQAELFCLLLSPTAVDSPWVNLEIETAMAAGKGDCASCPSLFGHAGYPHNWPTSSALTLPRDWNTKPCAFA
jgi:TIR domain-containing protein